MRVDPPLQGTVSKEDPVVSSGFSMVGRVPRVTSSLVVVSKVEGREWLLATWVDTELNKKDRVYGCLHSLGKYVPPREICSKLMLLFTSSKSTFIRFMRKNDILVKFCVFHKKHCYPTISLAFWIGKPKKRELGARMVRITYSDILQFYISCFHNNF